MPFDPKAESVVTGFQKVPSFAQGKVRDIRVRWACEEIGRPYRTELLDAFQPKPDDYVEWQPFAQVPAFEDTDVRIFESGAILLYLAEQDERLLPRDPAARWDAIAWLIAALNSVEPALLNVVWLNTFNAGKDWAQAALPAAIEFAEERLQRLSSALGDKPWLTGGFTVADIMMVTVLRNLDGTDVVGKFANLADYKRRGEDRPAFRQALSDQMADFDKSAQVEA